MKKVSRSSNNPDFRVSTSQLLLLDSPFILFEPKKNLWWKSTKILFFFRDPQGDAGRMKIFDPEIYGLLAQKHTAESVTRPGGVLWSAVICPGSLDVFVWGRYGEV